MKIAIRELTFSPTCTNFRYEAVAIDLKTQRKIVMYGNTEIEALQALDSTLERWTEALDKGRNEIEKYIDYLKQGYGQTE